MVKAKILLLFALFACNIILSLGKEKDAMAENISNRRRQTTQELDDYWTEERMKAAIPHDIVHEGSPEEFSPSEKIERNNAEQVFGEGQDSIFFPSEIDDNGDNETATGQSKRAYPYPYTSAYAPTYTTYPWRAVGKVFFTIPGYGDYVCSGSVLRRFVVQTAGHCVFDKGSWATNWIFVPGYNNGNRPYGTWYNYQMFTSADWYNSGSNCRDWGFSVIQKQSGNGVGDVVGYFGYSYNAGTGNTWRSLGYPAASPFNGEWNYYADSGFGGYGSPNGCSPNMLGIGSDATGGCSGGPWVIGFGGNNYVNSVNSWKFTAQPAAIYGPYFDNQWFSDMSAANAVTPP